jgi:hypothetical protein
MGWWFAAATDPLWSQQSVGSQQPQDSFAADVHAVLAAQPSPDLAVALAGERRGDQHLVDQLDQVGVADRGGRAWPATGPG